MYYINLFFIYSFLGFLFESIAMFISNDYGFNSGLLYGPWTFIYGIAIFVIMGLSKFLKQFKLKKWQEVILFYLLATILMTMIEFIGGNLIELLFHRVYWDYTNKTFNLGKYICLEVSVCWGLFATLVNYFVVPHLNKFAKIIPKAITIILVILFIIDIIMSLLN